MVKDRKKNRKKAEKSLQPPIPAQVPTPKSSSTKLTDLQIVENGVEETQANPVTPDKEPEEVEEPPVQDVPEYHQGRIFALIVRSYEGEKVHGLYEGEGFAYFEGGNTYKGMFSEGLMHGQGTYTWADGVKYEGTFVENMQMLYGRYTWNDGSIYEGSIKDGIRHGFGFFRSGTRPVSYIGYWCKGKRHGKGTVYYNQEYTSWYSGDWVNNVREGWGIRCYESGNIYEGQWEKNVRHGKGKMRWLTTNQEYMGQWVYGIQHGYGTHEWFLERMPESQYLLRNTYAGEFVNGDRHGRGKFIYANGAVYDGEWVCNKKHGKGKFVFQNGRVYEGEFMDDHMVEYPAFQVDGMNAEKLNANCSRIHFGPENIEIFYGSENTSILGSDIELDISSLLNLLPREERHEEVKQVEFAVLRYITTLRRVYTFYSSLGCDYYLDNIFLMTKFQFWRFLKDCQFHHSNTTLAEMDRLLSGDKAALEEIHCPHKTLLFRTFLSYLVHLAFHMYHEGHKEKGPYLQKCFLEMMSRNVIPAACHVQGIMFSEEQCVAFTMSCIDRCWEIYRAFRRPSSRPPFEPTMTMRHFLWMLDDFKLLSKQLTASRLVEILVKDGLLLYDRSSINLEQELVFLEFVEALLDCALVCVTSDMIKEQVDRENQKRGSVRIEGLSEGTTNVSLYPENSLSQPLRPCEDEGRPLQEFLPHTIPSYHPSHGDTKDHPNSSFSLDAEKEEDFCPAKELTDEPEAAKTEHNEEFSLQLCKVQVFLATKLFPAYQREKVLREKIKENRIRDAELAALRKIKDEELAKLFAEKAEEAKRREAKKLLEAESAAVTELQKPVPASAVPSKERARSVAPKVPGGKRKKKK
ncbi:radial spoke head 10 homolog B2-like [Phaenicophaeus curvirostris]|uniref:radial spoke head 10 homolog B2-like n=1 Tax=Phaenicophaeus curvirostris TaxID=33595 RepID=UPI0037F0EAEC